MAICHGCGGVIGVDCFNPQECEEITRQQAAAYRADESAKGLLCFVVTVRDMRDAQKHYFKTRDRDVLIRSKQLEKTVDDQIKALLPK